MIDRSYTKEFDKHGRDMLRTLYRDNRDVMLAIARRYFVSSEDAEDAIQDVFLRLAERMDLIKRVSENHRRGYLIVAVKHACIDRLRHKKRCVKIDDEDTIIFLMDQVAIRKDREDTFDVEKTLISLIRQLPSTMHGTLELRFVLGYTEREIASMQNISMSAVSMRITRAREMLRKILEEEGLL